METKRYLGDGVYVDFRKGDGMMVLTVEDGTEVTNEIFLEHDVIEALLRYIKDWGYSLDGLTERGASAVEAPL